jgi:hypothetical protein
LQHTEQREKIQWVDEQTLEIELQDPKIGLIPFPGMNAMKVTAFEIGKFANVESIFPECTP